ncbi:fumarylacetoacetate hydrolase family protein [Mycobacteroides franklinii]|uniref:fumarylacetoacetate hydrolase family protein n=1 Tax=Mycobacteroides franklinii TaxID=948102 RepID=UPI000993F204|nr:fumarylacetoacetate hydrolase family protein [Mycobacteroides franklinii]
MRWVTYGTPKEPDRAGLIRGDMIHALKPGVTLLNLLDEQDGLAAAEQHALTSPDQVVPLSSVDLRAPLQPRSIRDCLGFLQHLHNCASGGQFEISERYAQVPAFYFANTAAVIGPHDDVPISPGTQQFDYELEVCAVIGKSGANIRREDAPDHIAGYMILCDWSARDLQVQDMSMGLGPSKGKDGVNTLGPMLVTPDELEPHRNRKGFALSMTGQVNGETVSHGSWDDIDWDFADMVAYTSRGTRLRPGDIIGSGTVPTGCLLEHYRMDPNGFRGWLAPGDEVRLIVDKLGEIHQRIIDGPALHPLSTGF